MAKTSIPLATRLELGRRDVGRRTLTKALGSLLLAMLPIREIHGATRSYRLGVLWIGSAGESTSSSFFDELARQGFREHVNLIVDIRSANNDPTQLDRLAAELVRLAPDVILVASGTRGALAAKRATSTIPIVFGAVGDPVGRGLVASLAQPGGNLTGNAIVSALLDVKRVHLLAEALVPTSTIAVIDLGLRDFRQGYIELMASSVAGHVERIRLVPLQKLEELEPALQQLTKLRIDAVAINASPIAIANEAHIATLIEKYRFAAIADGHGFAKRGLLLTYTTDFRDTDARAARYGAKIFNGSKPRDLPVEVASKFQLTVNLKTAKTLGVKMPASLLAGADEIIK